MPTTLTPIIATGKGSPDGRAYDVVTAVQGLQTAFTILAANIPATAVASVAGATPAGGAGATAGAYDTAANRDVLIATVAEIKAQLNNLLVKLRAAGLITP